MPAATTTTARMTRERFMACPPSALHGRRRGRQRRRCRWLLRHCLLQFGQRQVGHDALAALLVDDDLVGPLQDLLHGLEVHALGRHFLGLRSEEHTSELQSLMRISYAVFCLKNKNNI